MLLIPLLLLGLIPFAPTALAAPPASMPAAELNLLWNSYGNQGGHWTGADSTASVPLPDGRIAWLFSDTFLGTVNPDFSRPQGAPMVNNTIVVQNGSALTQTLHGGTATAPMALVQSTDPNELYWVGDGTVVGNTLKAFYNRYRRTGSGPLDIELAGTALVTFALPALTVSGVQQLPLGNRIGWGSAILEEADYTYVYGTESAGALKFAHVARLGPGLAGAWQFRTAAGWSSNEADSIRLMSGVGSAFSVDRVGSQYVLVTADTNIAFGPSVAAHVASTPSGPFGQPLYLFDAPEPATRPLHHIYDVHSHPELAAAGKLLLSYNVNSLVDADNFADARVYRPRFVEVDWPRPVPDPGALPARPAGLTVTPDVSSIMVSWQAVQGATGYRLYQRDVTSGQTHFARYQATTKTSAELAFLIDDHTYEFRVVATNAAGESIPSETRTVTVRAEVPPAPANLRATANSAGGVDLEWSAVGMPAHYLVYKRDATVGEAEFKSVFVPDPAATRAVVSDLAHDHEYEFTVHARNGAGEGPASVPARATAHYAAPAAPTGLRATANDDGSFQLNWEPSGGNVWYWIYQRDVTAGETAFTRMTYPVTQGPSARPGGFLDGHEYEFKVSAIGRGGEGPVSTPARAISRYARPGVPTGLRATPNGDGSVSLEWTAPAPDLYYWIYQRDVTGGEVDFVRLFYPVTQGTSARPGGLMAGHEYEFKVAAINFGGEGPASATVRATVRYDRPAAPANLSATAGDGTVALAWTALGPDVWYWVYLRDVTTGETSFTRLEYPVTTGSSYTVGWLTNGHTYEFKVTGINAGGEGPESAVVSARPLPPRPDRVVGLVATPLTDGAIKLSWTAQSNVYYWVDYRDITLGQQNFTRLPLPAADPTATVPALTNGHIYEFKVAATNLAGDGPHSDPVRATATYPLPAAPANLRGAPAGDGAVDLAWDSAGPSLYYWLYRRDVTAGETTFTRSAYPTDKTFGSWAGLRDGHVYEFQVRAENLGGVGPASNTVAVTARGGLPAAPTGLRATAGNGQVVINWTASATPDVYYWVYYRDASIGEGFRRLDVPFGDTTATFSPLTNGHVYEFKVAATNWAGDSATTPVVSARPMPPAPVPVNLGAIAGNGEVGLGWNGSPHATYFWVEYRDVTAGQTGWQRVGQRVDNYAYTVRPLHNGHRYEFRVIAGNVAGESAPSNIVSAMPVPPPPAAPSNLRATAGNGQVALRWDPSPTPPVYYWVYFRPQGHGDWYYYHLPASGTSFTATGLWNGFTYEFKVTAANLGGQSGFSNTVSARPFLPPPAAPTGLTAAAGDRQVTLSWNASATPNVYYWVYFRPQGQSSWYYLQYPVLGTSLVVKPLWNGYTVEFKVTAANAGGQSGFSNTVSARPLPPPPSPPRLSAFPLPPHGIIRLEWFTSFSDGLYFWVEHRGPSTGWAWWRAIAFPVIAGPGGSSYFAEVWVSSLLEFESYDFRIVTINLAGEVVSNVSTAKAWPSTALVWARFTNPGAENSRNFHIAKRNQGAWDVYYFDWTDDGCSVPYVPRILADYPAGFPFRPGCERHDFGYGNHHRVGANNEWWRYRTDEVQRTDHKRVCDGYPIPKRWGCYSLGGAYYEAVRQFGQRAWDEA